MDNIAQKTYRNLQIVSVPIAEIRKVAIVQLNGLTMGEWYAQQVDKPQAMLNASLWDNNGAIGTIYENGKLVRNEGNGFGFGTLKNGGYSFGTPWDGKEWMDYITGYPALIRAGTNVNDSVDSYVQNAITKRSAMAADSKHIYLIAGNGITINQLRQQLGEFGAYYAINFDGGGSTRLMVGEKAINNPTDNRRNPNAVAIWTGTAPTINEPETPSKEEPIMGNVDVMIDPGHGKTTGGKRSFDSTLMEYEFNRDVTKRLKAQLERHGLKVSITAPGDEDVSLTERCTMANSANAKIFVSIHANAYGSAWNDAKGWEIYIYGKGGTAEKLANLIHKESVPYLGLKDRGVKVENFAVLRGTKMAAVLIEHGFYSNKEECTLLKTDAFRDKCAIADAKGILAYFGIAYKDESQPPPPSTDTPSTLYRVQCGAFSKNANAETLLKQLKEKGFDAFIVESK